MKFWKRPQRITALSLAAILLLSACAASPNTASPSTASPSKVPSENECYAQIVNDITKYLAHSVTYEEFNRGALTDLDDNLDTELVLLYLDGGYENYRIYKYSHGESYLLEYGMLFDSAGAAKGGISRVKLSGEEYVCIWSTNSEAGEHPHHYYSCRLLSTKGMNISYAHSYDFDYYVGADDAPMRENAKLYMDGEKISFEEFQKAIAALKAPEETICAVPDSAGSTFSELKTALDG